MNYKKIALSFILLFLNVNSHYNEEIFDFFYINKIEILSFFYLAAIVAYSREAFINNFNTIKYIITYLKFYIFNFDPNIQDKYGWTPLYSCSISCDRDLKTIKLLLNHPKIDPNIKKGLLTPLDWAYFKKNIEYINLLLNHPKIENNINYEQTNLHIACLNSNITAIKELLTKFHPNIRDKNGNTALHLACINNNAIIVKLLINDKRTSLDSKNDAGHTPLIIAANSKKTIEIIPILITHRIGFDERQYLFYKACKNFNIVNDLIKSIFSYYEVITINQQFHNCPKKNPLQLEQIRKNCITIVCQNKGYINPYQRITL